MNTSSPYRQEVLWIPESRRAPVSFTEGKRPHRVWTLFNHTDPSKPPSLPITPVHHDNAFLEDHIHDWVVEPSSSQLTKHNVCVRDDFSCQYCGTKHPIADLHLDHILPKSRGGMTVWRNVVTACTDCVIKKAGHTLENSGMKLLKEPVKPDEGNFLKYGSRAIEHSVWVLLEFEQNFQVGERVKCWFPDVSYIQGTVSATGLKTFCVKWDTKPPRTKTRFEHGNREIKRVV